MYLAFTVLLLLTLTVIVIIAIAGYYRFEAMSLRIAEADRLLLTIKNDKSMEGRLNEIIDTMVLMANAYTSLKDNYSSLNKSTCDMLSDVVMKIGEIQERYSDNFEQFEYCNDNLKEIKEMLNKTLNEESKENQNGSDFDTKEE